jgi:hypothetical protein
MTFVLGTVLPVLVYGALCAVLGALVYTTYLKHWKR